MFRHKSCGGEVRINLGGMFSVQSPSVVPTADGLSIGILQLSENESSESKCEFICISCGEEVDVEELEVECSICQRYHSGDDSGMLKPLGGFIGKSCADVIRGKKSPTNERQRHLLEYMKIPSDSQFVSLETLLSKPIIFS